MEYIKIHTYTNQLFFRLMGPPISWVLSKYFINGKNDSIYGKVYKNNMNGLDSFYPIAKGLEMVANNNSNLAFIEADPITHLHHLKCKVIYLYHFKLSFCL